MRLNFGIMHDEKPHIQSVGKIHKILLEYLVETEVGTTTIVQDGNNPCVKVFFFREVILHSLNVNVVADKHGGVVTDSHFYAKFAVAESLRPEAICSCDKKQPSIISFMHTGYIHQFAC